MKKKSITKIQKKRHKGVQKNKNKKPLTLKNAIRLKTIITMTTDYRNQNR
jgi:hypothetical protein